MPTLGDVFQELNQLKDDNAISDYAIGGATAVLFYAEPSRTYDVDVFVLLGPSMAASSEPLKRVHTWARKRGFTEDADHILVHGVPIQFIPAHNALAREAVEEARRFDYAGVTVSVIGPEHLVALALQAGGERRLQRAGQLLESGHIDHERLKKLLAAHAISAGIDDGR